MDMTLQPGVRAEVREDDTAYMALMGEVGWDIDPKDVASALNRAKGKPITVDIFSYGGDAMAGLAIYQMLATHDAQVTTNILGIAASAASVIAMGGSKRRCPSNAAIMIHSAWSMTVGDASDHRKSAETLEGITNAYLNTYAKASGRPVEEIRPYVMEESWLYGEDAFGLGLITEVVDPVMAMASAIPVPEGRFRQMPKSMAEMIAAPPAPAPAPAPAPVPVPLKARSAAPQNSQPAPDSATDSGNSIATDNPAEVATAASNQMTDINEAAAAAQIAERERVQAISGLIKAHSMPDSLRDELIENGKDLSEAREAVLARLASHSGSFAPGAVTQASDPSIGLTKKEAKRYSLVKLINYLGDPNPRTKEAAAFELECSAAAEKLKDTPVRGGLVPPDVLMSGGWRPRAAEVPGQTVGSFSDGGALVGTDRLDASFIELIRNRSAFIGSGLTVLSGLQQNVEIPKKLGNSTFYFVGENVDVPNSALAFGLITMIPRTIGCRVPISRRMMLQASPDIETLVRSDMVESVTLGMDKTIGYGSGNGNVPLGILRTAGIGAVTFSGGVSRAYPANLGGGTHDAGVWGQYVDLETELAIDNLDAGALRYIGNSVTRGSLKQTRRLLDGSDFIMTDSGQVNGYTFGISNQMEQNDVLFGNMQDAVLGLWSGLDLIVDPFTQSAGGQVIMTVHQDMDVAVRRPQSFALGS